jgi:hypothetical protein
MIGIQISPISTAVRALVIRQITNGFVIYWPWLACQATIQLKLRRAAPRWLPGAALREEVQNGGYTGAISSWLPWLNLG